MNIFFLSDDPAECAAQHCDKHVVKMVTESAQMLSTAHRVLDGTLEIVDRKKRWKHLTPIYDERLYNATHINHPDNVWIRETADQYMYLYGLYSSLADEYERRYLRKIKSFENLYFLLSTPPMAIWNVKGWRDPPQCMPDDCKAGSTVEAYRNYYVTRKIDFIRYTNRKAPDWLRGHLAAYHRLTGTAYER